jgi:hypothetical protein
VICHKDFGRNVFVGTIFTNAPPSSGVVQDLIDEMKSIKPDQTLNPAQTC